MAPLSEPMRVMHKNLLLSQEDFVKPLNVSIDTINHWDKSKIKPNITAPKKVTAFYMENNILFDEIETAWIAQKE